MGRGTCASSVTKPLILGAFGSQLVIDKPLSLLARRRSDASYILPNASVPTPSTAPLSPHASQRSYRLNAVHEEDPIIVKGTDRGFEKRRRFRCPRCELEVGYEAGMGAAKKGPCTFILHVRPEAARGRTEADEGMERTGGVDGAAGDRTSWSAGRGPGRCSVCPCLPLMASEPLPQGTDGWRHRRSCGAKHDDLCGCNASLLPREPERPLPP